MYVYVSSPFTKTDFSKHLETDKEKKNSQQAVKLFESIKFIIAQLMNEKKNTCAT